MTAGDGSDGSVLREHLSAIKGDPLLGIWAVIILLDPIYVFKSGLPQPGDILLFIFAPFVLARWKGRLRRQSARAARALMWFLGYVVLSAVLWSFIAGMWSFNAKRGFFQTPWF